VEQWRSQKFSMGELEVLGQAPSAKGKESLGAKPPALGDFLQIFQ